MISKGNDRMMNYKVFCDDCGTREIVNEKDLKIKCQCGKDFELIPIGKSD